MRVQTFFVGHISKLNRAYVEQASNYWFTYNKSTGVQQNSVIILGIMVLVNALVFDLFSAVARVSFLFVKIKKFA